MSLENEPLVTMTQLAKLVPKRNGRKVNVSSIYRWTTCGVRGVRLECVRAGGSVLSSHAAVERFFAKLADRAEQKTVPPVSNAGRVPLNTVTDAAKRAGEILDKVVFPSRMSNSTHKHKGVNNV